MMNIEKGGIVHGPARLDRETREENLPSGVALCRIVFLAHGPQILDGSLASTVPSNPMVECVRMALAARYAALLGFDVTNCRFHLWRPIVLVYVG